MKKIIHILLLIFIITSTFFSNINASECDYGELKAFFSKDGKHWQKATVYNVTLDRGETFFIKTIIKSKKDLMSIDVKLWETGEVDKVNSTFQLIKGKDCFYSYYDIYPVYRNDIFSLVWEFRVKPDTDWVNGNAPLNIYTQFDIDQDINQGLDFTIANIFVNEGLWHNYSKQTFFEEEIETKNNKKMVNTSNVFVLPLFTIIFIIILSIFIIIKKK